MRLLFALIVASLCSGCVQLEAAHVSKLHLTYSRPLVAKKSSVPVFIVYDAQDIKDDMPLEGARSDVFKGKVHEARSIVTKHLADALRTFFTDVSVVEVHTNPLPVGHVIAAHVQLTRLGYEPTGVALTGVMDWSLALKFVDEPEYFYRFTNQARGQRAIGGWHETNILVQGAIEEGFRRLHTDMEAKNVLRLADGAAPSGKPPTGTTAL